MTLEELRTAIRINIDDVNKTRFTDEQLLIKLNEGRKKIYRILIRNGIYTSTDTVTVSFVAGTQETTIVDSNDATLRDIQKAIQIKRTDYNTPIPIVPRDISIKGDQPTCYIIRETAAYSSEGYLELYKLGWYVEPVTSFDTTLYYAKKVKSYTGQYNPSLYYLRDIPEEWEDVLSYLVSALLLGSDEDNQNFWWGMYKDSLAEVLESGDIGIPIAGQVMDVDYGND